MTASTARFAFGALLVLGTVGTLFLRQPSDRASAYTPGGSVIYSAQILTPTVPGAHKPRLRYKPGHLAPGTAAVPHPRTQSALMPHPFGFTVSGPPTVSAALIDQVLTSYGSPMAGQGKALYDLGVKYGIDPAYCLAFFIHESAAGTRGEAVLTHNLGNIRTIAGAPSKDGYRYYDTWLEGAEGWYRLISSLYVRQWKLTTVDSIVPVYAPSGDSNDPIAYIDDVEQLVSAWRAQG